MTPRILVESCNFIRSPRAAVNFTQGYAMNKTYQDSTFSTTQAGDDPLEALARQGARQMLQAALEAEVSEYLQRPRYERGEGGEHRGYRNGYLPERTVTLGCGAVTVKVPRVSDEPEGERFQSALLKPYQKRSQTVEDLFPKLFVEGLATRDFEPALRSLLGAAVGVVAFDGVAPQSAVQGRV